MFRAAEAESRVAGLTAELQAAQHAEQARLLLLSYLTLEQRWLLSSASWERVPNKSDVQITKTTWESPRVAAAKAGVDIYIHQSVIVQTKGESVGLMGHA